MNIPDAQVVGIEASLLSRRESNGAQWFYMDLMFFLRGQGDDGDSDIDEHGSCCLHACYMPSTAPGPCLATKQNSNYKHHITNGNTKAQSRDKQKTNKQKNLL